MNERFECKYANKSKTITVTEIAIFYLCAIYMFTCTCFGIRFHCAINKFELQLFVVVVTSSSWEIVVSENMKIVNF